MTKAPVKTVAIKERMMNSTNGGTNELLTVSTVSSHERAMLLLRNLLPLVLILTAAPLIAQQPAIRRIDIETGWGGLGTPSQGTYTIECRGTSCHQGGKAVDFTKVERLAKALEAPVVGQVTMAAAGVDAAWLQVHVDRVQKTAFGYQIGTPDQINLFRSSFISPDFMAKVLPSLFRYTSFDDYPYAKLTVTFEGGRKMELESHSYYVFMIPWKMGQQENWNPSISRAVSDLLPEKAPEKERLRGDDLERKLAENTMLEIKQQWNLLGAESKAGSVLQALKRDYSLSQVDINPYHSEMFGKQPKGNGPYEENLHVILRRRTFPENFQIQLILEYARGRVNGLDEFLQVEPKYESLARSVPWLNSYLAAHPKVTATLYIVHGKSFGSHAMETFAKDMKQRRREDLISRLAGQQADIALLDIGSGLWIIFPDHSMILWRYELKTGLLKWSVKDFPEAECGDYRSNFGGCSGREVSTDGVLLPDRLSSDLACIESWQSTHPVFADADEMLFPVTQHGRTGYIDRTGKVRIPLCFESAGDFSEGLAVFERDKQSGYIDKSGSVVIEPRFPWAEPFSEGLAQVQVTGSQLGYDGRWGYIDHGGQVVIPPIYQNLSHDEQSSRFHEGRALVYSGTAYGFIDKQGKEVIPLRYSYAAPFSGGYAVVSDDERLGSWGAINRAGELVLPARYQWLSSFSYNLAAAKASGSCMFIDATGKQVISGLESITSNNCNGSFSEGLARWSRRSQFGYIDQSGKWVIDPRYDLASDFSEGLAAVRIGKQWGYINRTGHMMVKPHTWSNAGDFHDGLARIVTKNGVAYIDRTGKYVWGPTEQTD